MANSLLRVLAEIMIFMIMVVVMHTSALNDTTVRAERLVTGLAWTLCAWWKKTGLTVLVCTGLGSHGRCGLLEIKVSVY